MCCRARTPKISQVRAKMVINKKSAKFFTATTKSNDPHVPTFVFFLLVFVVATKKFPHKIFLMFLMALEGVGGR